MGKKEEKLLRFVSKACSSLISTSNKYIESLKKAQEAYTKQIEKLQKELEKAAKGMEIELTAVDLSIPTATAEVAEEPIITTTSTLETFASKTAPDDVFDMFSKSGPPTATVTSAPPRVGAPPSAGVPPSAGAPPRVGAPPSAGVPPSAGAPPRVGAPPSAGVPSVSVSPPVGAATVQDAASITDLRNAMMTELSRLKKLFAAEE